MRSLLLSSVFFVFLSALDEIYEIPTELDGILDERTSYIPLGHSRVFRCAAQQKVSHLVDSPPKWLISFHNPTTNKIERHTVSGINDPKNERFRLLDDATLLVMGVQRWHDGVVLECVVDTTTVTGSTTEVLSRYRLAVQDCQDEDKRNPCLYGICSVHGFPDLFEAVRCDCSPQYTGDFCTEEVEDRVWRELAFFSPIILMSIIIVLLYIFSEKIENSGRCKLLRLERHVPKNNRLPDMKTLYPATFLNSDVINRVLQARSEPENGSKSKESKETSKSKEPRNLKEISKRKQ